MATFIYRNQTFLAIPDNSVTSGSILVEGLSGHAVTSVRLDLRGLTHSWAGDLDILLLAPDGIANLQVMSDIQPGGLLNDSQITFADDATDILSTANLLASIPDGIYRPFGTPGESGADFGLPGLTVATATGDGTVSFASAFGGVDPNGTWRLFLADDAPTQTGLLTAWSLTIGTDRDDATIEGTNGADVIAFSSAETTSGSVFVSGRGGFDFVGVTGWRIAAGAGDDFVTGSGADDTIEGGLGRDTIFGGAGNDTFLVQDFDVNNGEVMDGGSGIDRIRLVSDIGAFLRLDRALISSIEELEFGGSADTRQVNLRADQIGPGLSDTALLIGSAIGPDRLEIAMSSARTLDLSGLRFETWDDADLIRITGVNRAETITGSAMRDTILGGGGNDILSGGAGDDSLNGGLGDDLLVGGAGADILVGDGGTDTASWRDSAAGILVDLANLSRNMGDAAGDQFVSIENFEGTAHADTFRGSTGNDRFFGGAGDDLLAGRDGDDLLEGGAGNDILRGGEGGDLLIGGGGTDILIGGGGGDTFLFLAPADLGLGAARDRIRDFERGTDIIDLRSLTPGTLSFLGTGAFTGTGAELRYVVRPNGVVLQIDTDGDGQRDGDILVLGVPSLTEADFLL